MKTRILPLAWWLAALLLPACSTLPPSAKAFPNRPSWVSTTDRERPWQLGIAWLPGGSGGAALRAAGLEHVLWRQASHVLPLQVTAPPAIRNPLAVADADERAWRKFCHHGIGLTPAERQRLQGSTPPARFAGRCHPAPLAK